MYEQTNTMMETKTTFQIPQLLDGDDFTSEDLADDMEGLRLSFTRIKIPGGGHLQFEIPSGNPDVPDYAPYLEGVILYSHNSNAYWPEGSEYDDDQPPLCQSFDGKVGYGEPGGTCADCVLNQFGSDGNNKGKACKNMRMLYLLRSGEYMPIQIALPPTSLTPYTRFVNEAFLSRRRKVCTGVVRIGLKKAVSGSHEYCVATFTKIADFAGEDLAHIRAYFTEKSLHRYRFSTIAWRSMNSSLNTFRRQEQRRQSHEFSYQAAHPPPDDAFDALRARLLLHDLFLLADKEQALLVRHRLHGCSLAETARREGMSVKRVRHRLKALYRAYFAQKETKQKEL